MDFSSSTDWEREFSNPETSTPSDHTASTLHSDPTDTSSETQSLSNDETIKAPSILPQKFQFIDVRIGDTTKRKAELRRHVQRAHLRQKRWSDSRDRKHSICSTLSRRSRSPSSSEVVLTTRSYSEDISEQTRDTKLPESCNIHTLVHLKSPSPKPNPGTATFDPFVSSLAHTRRDHELIHFFGADKSTEIYSPSNAAAWIRIRDIIFNLAISNPLAMNVVVAISAARRGYLRGNYEGVIQTFYHSRAISTLHKHLRQDPGDASDDIIAAIILEAIYDFYFPSPTRPNSAMLHWKAAIYIIRNRGGHISFAKNPKLRLLLLWWDYTYHSYDSHDWNFNFTSILPPQICKPSVQVISEQCEEFLISLQNANRLAIQQKGPPSPQPARHNVFKRGTNLHNLLLLPTSRSNTLFYYTQLLARLANLLAINAALWDYKDTPDLSERYLTMLNISIVEHDLDVKPCPETLCQVLIMGIPIAEPVTPLHRKEYDRPWWVGRMLKVAKRLGEESWKRVNDALFRCLTLEDGPGAPDSLDLEELRKEIEAAQLECAVPKFAK